jgi:PIN domain nuclease of toxin-antitoxin system
MGGQFVIVLDTHIFLWINLDQGRVPAHILNTIKSENRLGLAAISLWEIAMLVQYGRVTIPDASLLAWFCTVLKAEKLRILPITPDIAVRSGALEMHGDPADRLIAATALEHNCRLATVDDRLLNLKSLKTVPLQEEGASQ